MFCLRMADIPAISFFDRIFGKQEPALSEINAENIPQTGSDIIRNKLLSMW